MITIVMPSYNPDINEFKRAVKSALNTKTNEIIIVDDNSNKENSEYFSLLDELSNDSRVKVIYNKENKGRFLNSLFSLKQANNKYVKKLDVDDELVPENFNKVSDDIDSFQYDIVFTEYIYKGKRKNKSSNTLKWNLFNGSTIYSSSKIKLMDFSEPPRNYWGDVLFIMDILKDQDANVEYINLPIYKYNVISSTTASQLLKGSEDWIKGYQIISKSIIKNEKAMYTLERNMIFYELMMIKLGKEYGNTKYKYYSIFNYLPKFIKKIISWITFKF